MANQQQSTCKRNLSLARLAFLQIMFAIVLALAMPMHAQTLTVLHNFTGGADGGYPYAGLTTDRSGNFYGTTSAGGGYFRNGVVFRLSASGSGWILTPLYSFRSGQHDGSTPYGGVIFGPDGNFYGLTYKGGQQGAGTVYRLQPPAAACKSASCPWVETILYSFCSQSPNCTDGGGPAYGNLVFDRVGNLYGTTTGGGSGGGGVVFKLAPSGGAWTESVLYSFSSACGDEGCDPYGTLIFDAAGNLYGTTGQGGAQNSGVVFELSPSGSGWVEQTLASINVAPFDVTHGGLAMDSQGNLFGTTGGGEPGGVFELTPSNGGWTFSVLQNIPDNAGPYDTPTLDVSGNVYGTSCGEGSSQGEVFKLTHSNGGWIYTSVNFNGSNGECPVGSAILDAAGNLYGTTLLDGSLGYGTVWKVTP